MGQQRDMNKRQITVRTHQHVSLSPFPGSGEGQDQQKKCLEGLYAGVVQVDFVPGLGGEAVAKSESRLVTTWVWRISDIIPDQSECEEPLTRRNGTYLAATAYIA